MIITANCRIGLPERPKSELTDSVDVKAASVVRSTLDRIRLIR